MASTNVYIGSSGSIGDGIGTFQLLPAKSGYYYNITSVSLNWNSNGAYIVDAAARTFTITVANGSTTLINMGTYSKTANGSRPTISWSGSVNSTAGSAVNWVVVRNNNTDAGIKNQYYVTITYTEVANNTGSSSITVNKCMQSSNATLSISRSGNVSKVNIIYRDSSDGSNWGSWTYMATNITALSYSAAMPSVGNFRQFSVQSVWPDGTLGNGSGYPMCYRWSGSWTDNTLTSGSTKIKAAHMTEIQNLANKRRIAGGLSNASYTTITAGSTKLSGWTSHVNEIRNALNACVSQSWTTISSNNCAASIVTELRNKLSAM